MMFQFRRITGYKHQGDGMEFETYKRLVLLASLALQNFLEEVRYKE